MANAESQGRTRASRAPILEASSWSQAASMRGPRLLALARLEPAVRLVDDVGAPTAADHAAIPVARLERLQAIANLHGRAPASFYSARVVGLDPKDRRLN